MFSMFEVIKLVYFLHNSLKWIILKIKIAANLNNLRGQITNIIAEMDLLYPN